MSEAHQKSGGRARTLDAVNAGLGRRKAAEFRFRLYGLISICAGLLALVILFVSIIARGYSAFVYTYAALDIEFAPDVIDPSGARNPDEMATADYDALWKKSIAGLFPEVESRASKRALYGLISSSAGEVLREAVRSRPAVIGTAQRIWLPVDDAADMLAKGHVDAADLEGNERYREQKQWVAALQADGRIAKRFNKIFFTRGDSREPESAGILGAIMGSALTLVVTIGLSLPIGVAAAIYLEEFSPKNRWTDLVEVNINNLAAVPSIVFGLLGLAVFINFFEVPRSSPLVGGLVLTLMTLPVIIISGRSALKSVPPSVREAALGIGASPVQMVFHHVLPLAMPGMLTGAIIGTARALGESAPLLMIGMVAFIVDIPATITDPETVLPVQIYLWADSPERAFTERTSAAILVLLVFLIFLNGIAVFLRNRYERRW